MNLDSTLQALGSIRDRILRESGPGNIHEICQQFLEVRFSRNPVQFGLQFQRLGAPCSMKNGGARL